MRFIRKEKEKNTEELRLIAKENNISLLLAHALFDRGLKCSKEIEAFLNPQLSALYDPFLLPDMRAAVHRIERAIQERERICIYGDYDVDGVCASAILYTYFQSRGAIVQVYIPNRHAEGYGVNENAVHELHQAGVDLIITVDNGITAAKEIALCKSLGMNVIVSDHHQCPQALPDCVAVIDAHRADSQYPFSALCGAGVALKIVQALGADVKDYLALAAVATVADIVPLRDENRVIVARGLQLLHKNPGILELLRICGAGLSDVDSAAIAFRIAPRLNAAGRMGRAERAFALLIEKNADKIAELALILHEENARRQKEEQQIFEDAERMLQSMHIASMHALMLYSPDWNPGVIGIVASKLVEKYYKPVLLFTQSDTLLSGSCRSIKGINLFECLAHFEDRLVKFGGHAQAAGLTIELLEFASFQKDFNHYLCERVNPDIYIRTFEYDMDCNFSELSLGGLEELKRLEPYGEGNAEPILRTCGVHLKEMAHIGKHNAHMRAICVQGGMALPLVAFSYKGTIADVKKNADMLYTARINEWMGRKKVQLQLVAMHDEAYFTDDGFLSGVSENFYDAFFYNILYNVSGMHISPKQEDLQEQIVSCLRASISGVLLIAATMEGARALKELLLKNALADRVRVAYGSVKSGAGEHTLLLWPDMRGMNYARYQNVFWYDAAAYQDYIAFPAARESCHVHFGDMPIREFLTPLRISREIMGRYYHAYCTHLKEGAMHTEALINKFSNKVQARLVLLVFYKLGFFEWDNVENSFSRILDMTQKKDLHDSPFYKTAQIS